MTQLSAGASRQVHELLQVYPCRTVNPEASVLDLPLDLPGGRGTALRISLPSLFPQDSPTLSVLTPVRHPVVDATGRIHTDALGRWDYRIPERSSLVQVVADCLAVLQAQPASAAAASSSGVPMSGTGAGSLLFPGGVPGGIIPHLPGPGAAGARPNGIRPPPPGGPSSSGAGGGAGPGNQPHLDLEALPTSRLEELLTSDEAFQQYVTTWLQRTPAAKALADIKAQNATIARDNLEMQAAIDEARTHVAIVRSGDYATMRTMFDELYGRQQAIMAKMGPEVITGRLRREADEVDAASDALLEAYPGSGLGLEALVEGYAAKRDAFHTMDLKRQAAEHHLLG